MMQWLPDLTTGAIGMKESKYYKENALPSEVRELMLRTFGLVHETDLDVLSATKHRGRARWKLPSILVGTERYYRVDDLKVMIGTKLQQNTEKASDNTPLA